MNYQSRLDPYGFERPEDFDYETYNSFISGYLSILARRKSRWNRWKPSKNLKHSDTLKRFIRKGIPEEHRKWVWLRTSGAAKMMEENKNLYRTILRDTSVDASVDIIKIDIPRTFPENVYFQHQGELSLSASLYNVLVAFSRYHPDIGYCQGLNYIVGLLLLVVKDEEAAFWLLVALTEKIIPDYHSTDLKGLKTDINVLSHLVRDRHPLLHQHLDRLGLTWPLFCTKWFVCVFVDALPVETVLRIWDCLFYEGSKVILRVGITLMSIIGDELLLCTDISQVITLVTEISKRKAIVQCHDFMKTVFKVPGKLTTKEIAQLRVKYSSS
ncbi:hypothetical protein CHUAL_001412 [Chamberlinius hualienensis]